MQDRINQNIKTPLVSVAVMAYNSAETIIATLESVKAQTYRRLELVIGDDGSKDDTAQLCRTWIDVNRTRFERVELLVSPENHGISANYNQVMDACRGEWGKDLDGDDLLNADCIEQLVAYVQDNPNAEYVFCKVQPFCMKNGKMVLTEFQPFNYDFFEWPVDKQLEHMLFSTNCIPSPGLFYNLPKIKEIGLRNDERIPLLEDWPKWINALRKGLHFYFIDKPLVMYRVGDGISTSRLESAKYYETCRRFVMLYQYPAWVEVDPQDAMERIIKHEKQIYETLLRLDKNYHSAINSYAYRIGRILLSPMKWLKTIISK